MNNLNVLKIIFLTFFVNFIFISKAQNTETPLLIINDNSYSVEEFNYIYDKNNSISKEPVSNVEYIELFVNYKLKVTEAIAQGFDTLPNFKKELAYYCNELAKPYLMDKKATEDIAKEAYGRMLEDVDVSHILLRLPKNAYPGDTLKAFNKISEIRGKIIDGADFEQMAIKYSEDPSVKKNRGRLGYISAFQTVYPFESAAYSTSTGEVSPVVRTSFGYHIVKVNGKIKSPGEIKVAHIMKVVPRDVLKEEQDIVKNKIDSIYQLLQNVEDFKLLAEKYSDDRNSAAKGGELDWFSTGRMIPEFADAAFAIPNNNEFSEPVRTRVGWHIIYRLDKRGVKPYADLKDNLLDRISNGERSLSGKTATIKRLKKENDFKIDISTVEFLKKNFATTGITITEFYNKLESYKDTFCSIADTTLYLSDLENYLKKSRGFNVGVSPVDLDSKLNDFYDDKLIEYEKAHLEEKYPQFKYLMNEYYDGLLIFEISQKEIWNKAATDSVGLLKFFEDNRKKYFTPEKFNGSIFFCKNKKSLKVIKEHVKDSITSQDVDTLKSMCGNNFVYRSGEYVNGDNALYDAALWNVKPNEKIVYPEGYSKICFFGKFMGKKPLEFDDVKGLVIADYQTYIEKEWIKQLKEKYKPIVNLALLKKSKR